VPVQLAGPRVQHAHRLPGPRRAVLVYEHRPQQVAAQPHVGGLVHVGGNHGSRAYGSPHNPTKGGLEIAGQAVLGWGHRFDRRGRACARMSRLSELHMFV
jgi:hypothetical protein